MKNECMQVMLSVAVTSVIVCCILNVSGQTAQRRTWRQWMALDIRLSGDELLTGGWGLVIRKIILLFCACLVVAPCRAQSDSVITFGDRFETFTNLQGRVYEHVQLIRAEDGCITYRVGDGGGRVYYTNVAPATLESFGISAGRIAAAAEQAKQEVFQAEQLRVEERECMSNPSNWQTIHITGLNHTIAGVSGWRWTVAEIPGMVIIYNVPSKTLAYFNGYFSSVTAMQELTEALSQHSEQISQLEQKAAQLDQEVLNWKKAEAGPITRAGGDPTYVDATTAVGQRINLWGIDVLSRQQQTQNKLSALKPQQDALTVQLQKTKVDLKKWVDDRSEDSTEIKAFVTSTRYYGSAVLISTGQ